MYRVIETGGKEQMRLFGPVGPIADDKRNDGFYSKYRDATRSGVGEVK